MLSLNTKRILTSPHSHRSSFHQINSRTTKSFTSKGRGKLTQSSRKWLQRHDKDEYVKRAKSERSPSRAIYKLEEILARINNKNNKKLPKELDIAFLGVGNIVIDLGAAPGGWSLFASKKIGKTGNLIAVDLLQLNSCTSKAIEMESNFHFIRGDFTSDDIKEDIVNILPRSSSGTSDYVDCIISDMAANFTGDKMTDAIRTMNLCEEAMVFAAGSNCFDEVSIEDHDLTTSRPASRGLLRPGGSFLCKYFACGRENEKDLMTAAKTRFKYSMMMKPPASRKESAEMYLFATGFMIK